MEPTPTRATVRMCSRRVLAVAALGTVVLALAACGGGGKSGSNGQPKLVGTEIPTVSPVAATAASCVPPQPLALPANFPTEITLPLDYVVWSIETTPHLRVVGRTTPPASPKNEVPKGVTADAVLREAAAGSWKLTLHDKLEALDYDFTLPDGRQGNFTSATAAGCPGQVILTFDAHWVTG